MQVKVDCMVGAIVRGCDTRQQNPKPTKPHFFFIGFVWDTSLNFAFKALKVLCMTFMVLCNILYKWFV